MGNFQHNIRPAVILFDKNNPLPQKLPKRNGLVYVHIAQEHLQAIYQAFMMILKDPQLRQAKGCVALGFPPPGNVLTLHFVGVKSLNNYLKAIQEEFVIELTKNTLSKDQSEQAFENIQLNGIDLAILPVPSSHQAT